MAKLTPEALQGALTVLPGWQVDGDLLRKAFRFRTFRDAMAFVNRVAEIATEERHHPEVTINYNRVTLSLTTHDEGGLTEKDVAFARRVEAMPAAG